MTDSPFAPSRKNTAPPKKQKKAGGDDGVERDELDRPRIIVGCAKCSGVGRLPSQKKPAPATIQCPTCKGEGKVKRSYTRTTTYIDCLEDKKNLDEWNMRMVLIGVAMDPSFTKDVLSYDPESKDGKNALNRRAEAAKEVAGASKKADQGTWLHELSEIADKHEELPLDIDPQDYLDILSYTSITHPLLKIVRMEQLVVNDELKVAGTPDRVSSVLPGVTLVSPCRRHGDKCRNGVTLGGEFKWCLGRHVFTPDELIITDLKTGRVDYGQLKMAMQLAIYAHSDVYGKETGERIDKGPVNQDWGIIMHTAAGSGVTTLYWADIRLGWEAVQVAGLVRKMRSQNSKALIPLATTDATMAAAA